jgi:hypothetical protein
MVDQEVHCSGNHRTTIKVKGGRIIDLKAQRESPTDIDDYVDVPVHIKDVIKEAHICLAQDATKAGASMVRLVLDVLLFEKSFTNDQPMAKVNALEQRCQGGGSFESSNRPLCRRIVLLKTIAGLAGYHAHAQKHFLNVLPEEFETYLVAVESAVKETWPRRL